MSENNVIPITTLAGIFDDEQSLQEYCDRQFKLIEDIRGENKRLQEEVEHLKFIIASNTEILPTNEVIQVIVSKEQALIEEQIGILQGRSIGRELELDDVKKLDLLIKNLNLIKNNQPKTINAKSKKFKASNDKLLEVASKPVPENEQ